MLERPTVIPGPLDRAVELGDNPPSIPLDPKRSETRFPSELVLVGVADAEPRLVDARRGKTPTHWNRASDARMGKTPTHWNRASSAACQRPSAC